MSLADILDKLLGPTPEEGARRAKAFDELVQKNPDFAPTAEDYRRGLSEYLRTGLPPGSRPQEVRSQEGQARMEPNPSGGVPISVLPDTVVETKALPIRIGSAKAHVKSGNMTMQGDVAPTREAVASFGAAVPPAPPSPSARAIFFNAQTGAPIRVMPISGESDKFVPVGSRASSGDDPQDRFQKNMMLGFIKDYQKAVVAAKGGNIPGEIQDRATWAAQELGLPVTWQKDVQEPGFWGKLMGNQSQTSFTPFIGGDTGEPPAPPAPAPGKNIFSNMGGAAMASMRTIADTVRPLVSSIPRPGQGAEASQAPAPAAAPSKPTEETPVQYLKRNHYPLTARNIEWAKKRMAMGAK